MAVRHSGKKNVKFFIKNSSNFQRIKTKIFVHMTLVFILGEAGTGKSQIWRTLYSTYIQQERNPIVYDLNPKCMSNNELFGFINSATREWKDGLLSFLIRDQAKYANDNPKWIAIGFIFFIFFYKINIDATTMLVNSYTHRNILLTIY